MSFIFQSFITVYNTWNVYNKHVPFYTSSTLVLFSTEPGLKLGTVVIHNISFVTLAVRDVIEYLWYGQTIVLEQAPSALYTSGLIVWSLWLIYFVCHAGKLDSLFPDDSYIDMGEIDVGRKVTQQIPPGVFWRSQVFIDHPMYLKFNVSLSKDALVGIYGRRGLPPSHTQVGKTCVCHSLFSFVFFLPFLPFSILRNNVEWIARWDWISSRLVEIPSVLQKKIHFWMKQIYTFFRFYYVNSIF